MSGKRGLFWLGGLLCFLLVTSLFFSSVVLAHGTTEEEEETGLSAEGLRETFELASTVKARSLQVLLVASLIVVLVVVLVLAYEEKLAPYKKALYLSLVIPILVASIFLIGSTIFVNVVSITKGPVHWHADYEVWACGEKLDLVDPEGLQNRIGTAVLHEHGDDRIHVEGVVHRLEDVDLGSYLETIGAQLHDTHLAYPTTEGLRIYANGDACPDGRGGVLKVYANGQLVAEPETYIIAPESQAPPGDCIIIDFGPEMSDTTNRICASWKAKGWTYEMAPTRELPSAHDADDGEDAHGS